MLLPLGAVWWPTWNELMASVLLHVDSCPHHLTVSFKQEAKELIDVEPKPHSHCRVVPSRSVWRALTAMCEAGPRCPSLSGTSVCLHVLQSPWLETKNKNHGWGFSQDLFPVFCHGRLLVMNGTYINFQFTILIRKTGICVNKAKPYKYSVCKSNVTGLGFYLLWRNRFCCRIQPESMGRTLGFLFKKSKTQCLKKNSHLYSILYDCIYSYLDETLKIISCNPFFFQWEQWCPHRQSVFLVQSHTVRK